MSAKIIPIGGITTLDIPIDTILEAAKGEIKDACVLMGWDNENEIYFASSSADVHKVLWLIEQCKKQLLEMEED